MVLKKTAIIFLAIAVFIFVVLYFNVKVSFFNYPAECFNSFQGLVGFVLKVSIPKKVSFNGF